MHSACMYSATQLAYIAVQSTMMCHTLGGHAGSPSCWCLLFLACFLLHYSAGSLFSTWSSAGNYSVQSVCVSIPRDVLALQAPYKQPPPRIVALCRPVLQLWLFSPNMVVCILQDSEAPYQHPTPEPPSVHLWAVWSRLWQWAWVGISQGDAWHQQMLQVQLVQLLCQTEDQPAQWVIDMHPHFKHLCSSFAS